MTYETDRSPGQGAGDSGEGGTTEQTQESTTKAPEKEQEQLGGEQEDKRWRSPARDRVRADVRERYNLTDLHAIEDFEGLKLEALFAYVIYHTGKA